MELSERIKTARLAAGLSQRQLCGDVITRNMLSLIESGKARPSMDTLRHFGQVLGKPLSYFLEEDAVLSPNQQVIRDAETAYGGQDYETALKHLQSYTAPDPVFDNFKYLLETLSCDGLAEKAIAAGKFAYALTLLEQSEEAASRTPYAPHPDKRTLLRYKADPATAKNAVLTTTDGLLLRAERAILARNDALALQILEAAETHPPRWHLLRGTVALHTGDYPQAVRCLNTAEETYPRETAPMLELAYLRQQDYKKAYEYAKKQAPETKERL